MRASSLRGLVWWTAWEHLFSRMLRTFYEAANGSTLCQAMSGTLAYSSQAGSSHFKCTGVEGAYEQTDKRACVVDVSGDRGVEHYFTNTLFELTEAGVLRVFGGRSTTAWLGAWPAGCSLQGHALQRSSAVATQRVPLIPMVTTTASWLTCPFLVFSAACVS